MKKKKNTDGNGVNKQRTHIHTEHSEKKIERVSIKITDTCLFKNNSLCFSFFIGLINSMQGWTDPTRRGVTRKRSTKKLKEISLERTYSL